MPDKPPMPDNLRALAVAARKRVQSRRSTGDVEVVAQANAPMPFASPYADEDEQLWFCLLLDCFGTRLPGVVTAFVRQLHALMPDVWVVPEGADAGHHEPDKETLEQALSILCSIKPRNEAQAAGAAQAVALHLAQMKVSNQLGGYSYLHPQSAAALAVLSKAYDAKLKSIRELQTGGKAKRQVITVNKNVTLNYVDNRSIAMPAGKPREVAALPSPDQSGEVVSFARREGETPLPDARLRAEQRSASR